MSTTYDEYGLQNASRADLQYKLLGEIPVLPGENASELDALWEEVRIVLQPVDFIDKILARDFVKLFWEEKRLYRLKAEFLKSSAHLGLELILKLHVDYSKRRDFIEKWAQGDPKTVEEVNAILSRAGLNRGTITAETYFIKLREMENIDRMIAAQGLRRNNALRELTHHREFVARSLMAIAHKQRGPIDVPDE